MSFINQTITKINTEIDKNTKNYKFKKLINENVIEYHNRDDDVMSFITSSEEVVVPDSRYELFLYHRANSIDYREKKMRGKKIRFDEKINFDCVVFFQQVKNKERFGTYTEYELNSAIVTAIGATGMNVELIKTDFSTTNIIKQEFRDVELFFPARLIKITYSVLRLDICEKFENCD